MFESSDRQSQNEKTSHMVGRVTVTTTGYNAQDMEMKSGGSGIGSFIKMAANHGVTLVNTGVDSGSAGSDVGKCGTFESESDPAFTDGAGADREGRRRSYAAVAASANVTRTSSDSTYAGVRQYKVGPSADAGLSCPHSSQNSGGSENHHGRGLSDVQFSPIFDTTDGNGPSSTSFSPILQTLDGSVTSHLHSSSPVFQTSNGTWSSQSPVSLNSKSSDGKESSQLTQPLLMLDTQNNKGPCHLQSSLKSKSRDDTTASHLQNPSQPSKNPDNITTSHLTSLTAPDATQSKIGSLCHTSAPDRNITLSEASRSHHSSLSRLNTNHPAASSRSHCAHDTQKNAPHEEPPRNYLFLSSSDRVANSEVRLSGTTYTPNISLTQPSSGLSNFTFSLLTFSPKKETKTNTLPPLLAPIVPHHAHIPAVYTESHGPSGERRVAVRLPSLYAAEWVADHRALHLAGGCKCPVDFTMVELAIPNSELTPEELARLREWEEQVNLHSRPRHVSQATDESQQQLDPVARRIAEIERHFGRFDIPAAVPSTAACSPRSTPAPPLGFSSPHIHTAPTAGGTAVITHVAPAPGGGLGSPQPLPLLPLRPHPTPMPPFNIFNPAYPLYSTLATARDIVPENGAYEWDCPPRRLTPSQQSLLGGNMNRGEDLPTLLQGPGPFRTPGFEFPSAEQAAFISRIRAQQQQQRWTSSTGGAAANSILPPLPLCGLPIGAGPEGEERHVPAWEVCRLRTLREVSAQQEEAVGTAGGVDDKNEDETDSVLGRRGCCRRALSRGGCNQGQQPAQARGEVILREVLGVTRSFVSGSGSGSKVNAVGVIPLEPQLRAPSAVVVEEEETDDEVIGLGREQLDTQSDFGAGILLNDDGILMPQLHRRRASI